ncbi:hypothetical protein [Candidatus Cloacimonas acidaminovorans]|uniref:Uncharacterized protein n=1 Tax=Cloacimonas acidaminovorans (strain Evry) TaxID=459349 RepID=B0VI82_CLOAI|nr:hypothetical protein [Candidatus Cloacimonas acidaminovorans]CAO81058.1 hypothetical protein CLOAM1197 [Candidatus Cloacimonas acidaminovorans str. Evry]
MSANKNTQTERRIIYLVLLVAVALPLIFPIGWKTEVSSYTKMAWELIQNTPDSSVVVFSFDYDPSTLTEIQPMAEAMLEHSFSRNQKIIAVALWPQGVQMADQAFTVALKKYPEKKYGVDYVNLGYKVAGIVAIQAMGKSMQEVFPSDQSGTKYENIPMLKKVKTLKDVAYICSLSSGTPGIKEWVMAARDPLGTPVTGGTTAVSAPGLLPYVNSQKQLYGLLGGLKAASEYETLINKIGSATIKMDAQSIAHLLILVFIIIGNIKAFYSRKRGAQ